MTEEYLLLVSTVYKRSFFQDLPFMWIKNPDHVLFSHKFFEDYHDEWRRWCMISLSYSQFMEKTHQGYLSKYSWSDAVLHTREAFNHAMEHMKRGCFDVLLGCGNQELGRQLSSAVEETRQAMFTQVNDFKKRQVTLMLQLQQHDHVDLQKIQSDLIQHWSTLCQEHASSTSAAQLPLIHHLQQQTEGMRGTSSMRHNHLMTKALHTIIGQNHNTTSQVHTLTLLMNDMMEEMNKRAQQDLHVNKTEHEITRQRVNRLVVAKDWYAQQPGALDSQSTVQRLSQVVQPLNGTNAKSIGRLGNARKRHIFMSSQSLILSDEEAHALQAVAQKEHNAHVALQLGRGGTGAAAAAMQWGEGSAGPAASAAPPAEALQLVGGDAVAAITAMHWKSSATGLEAAAIPHADALQLGRGGTGAATAAMQWRGGAAGLAAESAPPAEVLQLGGGGTGTSTAAMQWRGGAAGLAAAAAPPVEALQFGGGGTGAAAAAMQWRGGAAGLAAESTPPAEVLQLGGRGTGAATAAMQWRGGAAGLAAAAAPPVEALQFGGGGTGAAAAAMQWRGGAAGPAAGVATPTMPLETTLCMTVKDKRSATVATSVTVTVPFVVPSFWVIPSRRVDQHSTGLSQMMHWPQDKKWEDLNIYDVLQWWDEGMTMLIEDTTVAGCKREVHLAAFRLLEHPLLRHKWKYQGGGNTISKPMIMVNNVVYGVHKRVKGLPRKEGDTMHEKLSLEDAVQDLKLVLQNYSKSLKSNIRNKPTLYKLAESSLITGNKEGCLKEFTPEEYEKKVLKNDLSIFTEPSSSWK